MHVKISTGSYQKYVKLSDNEVKQVMTATFETNLKIAQTIEEKNNALPKEKQIPIEHRVQIASTMQRNVYYNFEELALSKENK